MCCSYCEKLQDKLNANKHSMKAGDECPIHDYDGVTIPGPHMVIKFKDKLYAYSYDELYAYDDIASVWSKVDFPAGLIYTPEDGLNLTSDEYSPTKHTCSCDSQILFSKGCQCGGI